MRDDMVIAKSYNNETQARIDQTRLKSLGLDSLVQADNCDGMYPQMDLLAGVKLLVRKEDASQVSDLLSSQATSMVDHPWDCPGCGEHIDAGFDSCWQCGVTFCP